MEDYCAVALHVPAKPAELANNAKHLAPETRTKATAAKLLKVPKARITEWIQRGRLETVIVECGPGKKPKEVVLFDSIARELIKRTEATQIKEQGEKDKIGGK